MLVHVHGLGAYHVTLTAAPPPIPRKLVPGIEPLTFGVLSPPPIPSTASTFLVFLAAVENLDTCAACCRGLSGGCPCVSVQSPASQGRFAYAWEHECKESWRNARSNRRIGIVNGGVTGPDWQDWATREDFDGFIGTPRSDWAHQSARAAFGNLATRYRQEDVQGTQVLKDGDVVVYDLQFLEDPAGLRKPIRQATRIVLITKESENVEEFRRIGKSAHLRFQGRPLY